MKISWLLTKNLKESYYDISAGDFFKNNIAYDFRVEIYFRYKWKFCFQLQQMYSCEFLVKVCVSQEWGQAEITVKHNSE